MITADVPPLTRTEHSRSLEDAEQYRALETLTELGLLTPANELELYHGRVARTGETRWDVDLAFANGGVASGNGNMNERPTLYTTDKYTARDFADKRMATNIDLDYWQAMRT